MMIKLDKPYQHNYSIETGSWQGEIVTKAIDQKPPSQYDKAIDACKGVQQDFFKIPSIRTHVFVIGSYVLDAEKNWRKIQPIARIYMLINNLQIR
jgi:hypothetical protein